MAFLGILFRFSGGVVGLASFAGFLFLLSAMGLYFYPDMPVCSEIYRWGSKTLQEAFNVRRNEVIGAAILFTILSGIFCSLLDFVGIELTKLELRK